MMEKERLEWVMSGLSHYNLTAREDQFVKLAKQDFNQTKMLTEEQEEKLESLYKEKSKLKPNRNYNKNLPGKKMSLTNVLKKHIIKT